MKIRSVGAELLHADRRTDMKTLIVVFRISAKAPINERKIANLGYLYFKTSDKSNVKNC
jgi:hypothetical protein